MPARHMVLFYVTDPAKSADFYQRALGLAVIDVSPGFAMLQYNDGTMLGLWNKSGVKPTPDTAPGASELGLHLNDNGAVDGQHHRWQEAGIEILQAPTQMDFGYTCTARDPDGHRIRVFAAA